MFAPPWNCAEPEFIISQPPLYWLPICFIEINEICSRYCPIFSNFMFANVVHFDPLFLGTSLMTNSHLYLGDTAFWLQKSCCFVGAGTVEGNELQKEFLVFPWYCKPYFSLSVNCISQIQKVEKNCYAREERNPRLKVEVGLAALCLAPKMHIRNCTIPKTVYCCKLILSKVYSYFVCCTKFSAQSKVSKICGLAKYLLQNIWL